MPWIHATVSQPVDAGHLASQLAAAAASATGLGPSDIVVLVTVADASSGSGAVVTVTGRERGEPTETDLTEAVRRVVAASTGVHADLVAVLRA